MTIKRPDDRLVRAARELLRWDQHHLAGLTGLHVMTIRRFEAGADVDQDTVDAIVGALQKAGVAFVAPQGKVREGVTLSKAASPLERPAKRVYPPRPKKKGAGTSTRGPSET